MKSINSNIHRYRAKSTAPNRSPHFCLVCNSKKKEKSYSPNKPNSKQKDKGKKSHDIQQYVGYLGLAARPASLNEKTRQDMVAYKRTSQKPKSVGLPLLSFLHS